jgi:hypothetical protein
LKVGRSSSRPHLAVYYIMDLTGHPTHFPQLEIMCPFPALAASPSRYASVSPSWSMRKRSHHCRRRESNRSRRSNTSPHPPDLVVFPRVRFIIASPRPTLAMPVKIIVRTPILHRQRRSRSHPGGATGSSRRLNSGETPMETPHTLRRPLPSATTRSQPPVPNWMVEI